MSKKIWENSYAGGLKFMYFGSDTLRGTFLFYILKFITPISRHWCVFISFSTTKIFFMFSFIIFKLNFPINVDGNG